MQTPTSTFNLVEIPAASEHDLQEVVKSNPQLVPAQDLGLDGDLLVVGRETTLASGSIDLLCLSRTGELVLIEFKTGPQNPDFRHAGRRSSTKDPICGVSASMLSTRERLTGCWADPDPS
jgi:hypothetical protein